MPDPAPNRFPCPWLGRDVELTTERELHIEQRHPEVLRNRTRLAETLAEPDRVRRSDEDPSILLFSRWYTDVGRGRHIVVVVVDQSRAPARSWIVTAYRARRIPRGEV
jgi:hypothetical protein